jgi:4'-phosphopantetheinyl transferase
LLDRSAAEIVLRSAAGKPALTSPPGAVFSVAHRRGASLVGAAWGGELGVDLEVVDPRIDGGDIADTLFGVAEAGWVRSLSADQRALGFVAMWATKEAVLKARGRGITSGLETPVVDGAALMPLMDGADRVALDLPETAVELRLGSIRALAAIACVARRRS